MVNDRRINDQIYLRGALDEMKFWGRIVFEHLKFHRQGVDPGNEKAFKQIEQNASKLEQFYNTRILNATESASNVNLNNLITQTLNVMIPAKNFQNYLHEEINNCRMLSLIDGGLGDHMVRETEYFIGQLRYVLGEQTPMRGDLGIESNAHEMALTVPRRLLSTLSGKEFFKCALENIMFFSRIHGEHAHTISQVVIPELQEEIRLEAIEYEQLLFANVEKAEIVESSGEGLEALLIESFELATSIRDFLYSNNVALHRCAVPGGRINAWPLMADHITREAQYFVDVLNRLMSRAPTPPSDAPYFPYIV